MAGTAALALLCGALSAPSLAAPRAPLTVRAARLAQRGRSLRLTATLGEPLLSSRMLSRQHRSLCLLLERRRSGAPFEQLCLAPPGRGHRGARLRLAPLTGTGADMRAGPSRTIAGRIARPSLHVLRVSFRPASAGIGYRSLRWQLSSGVEPPACVPAKAGAEERAPASADQGGASEGGTGEGARPQSSSGEGGTGEGARPQSSSGEGGGCRVLYPSRPRRLRMHTPKLVGCVRSRSRSPIFEGPSGRREIALTFDDGPWNDPPSIDFVNLLHRYHAPATFFEIGSQIGSYDPTGAIERRMLADGDMIGDHTWTHPDMLTLSAAQQRSQLQLTARAIRRATGFTPCLWRPPYGDVNAGLDSLAGSLGMSTILWNIDPRDWSLPGVGAIEANVLSNARGGAIADMHFGGGPRGQTLAALPHIITTLRSRGYRLVTVTKLLGLRLIYR